MPIIIAIIAVVALVGAGMYYFTTTPAATEPTVTVEETMNEPVAIPTEPAPGAGVTDTTPAAGTSGTFSTKADYLTPARVRNEIDVVLTIDASGIITSANILYDGVETFTSPYQERFDGAFSAEVIGQSIDTVSLARVGGASLTSNAFNEAVAIIRADRG